MEFTAKQIAQVLNGTIEGNELITINTLSKIEEGSAGSLSFLANPKYTPYIYTTQASIVIVNKSLELTQAVTPTLIRVEDASIGFTTLLEMYSKVKNNKIGISKMCSIAPSATVGKDVYIGDFVSIGDNVHIGDNVKIFPNVTIGDNSVIGNNTVLHAGIKIYDNMQIGSNCIFHAGCVIGSDGFGFVTQNNNQKIPQIGNVIIEDNVEMGANCCIDRATMGSTIVRRGVKFDNMVHLAHNVEVGENTCIACNTIIAGTAKIGKNCLIAGQVGIVGHLKVADNTTITAQSGITKSIVKSGEIWMGSPAFEFSKYKKSFIHFRNFEDIVERLEQLEKNKSH